VHVVPDDISKNFSTLILQGQAALEDHSSLTNCILWKSQELLAY